jgi:hypothetical protein
MQMNRCESSSFSSFLITALFLTKNVAPQLGTGVGPDVATCSASFSSVAFLDVGFNGRSHGRSRARRLRRGFCSGSSYGLPCRSHGLFEGQNPVGGLVIDVVGDADLRLLVVAAFVVITPADKPNAALSSFAIAQMRFRIEATPMHAKLEPGARFSRRNLSLGECLRHSVRRVYVEYPSNINPCTLANNTGLRAFNLLKLLNVSGRWRTEKDPLFGPLKPETGVRFP